MSSAPGRTLLGHPAGIATLFFVEMWERLSFYGMRALLILFLVDQVAHGGLGLDDRTASAIYGMYVGATYLACLPGGWVGDRVLGSQRAVLMGGIVITCGHLLLGFAPSTQVFFFGLLVIVIVLAVYLGLLQLIAAWARKVAGAGAGSDGDGGGGVGGGDTEIGSSGPDAGATVASGTA